MNKTIKELELDFDKQMILGQYRAAKATMLEMVDRAESRYSLRYYGDDLARVNKILERGTRPAPVRFLIALWSGDHRHMHMENN